MTARIRYFAAARDLAGTQEERVALPEDVRTVEDVLAWLGARHPALRPYVDRLRLAVDGEIALPGSRVGAGSEIDVLPPVAGGDASLVRIDGTPLSVDECVRAVSRRSAGAVAVFIGTVRDEDAGRAVRALHYEAHPELAEREMRRVVDEIERETGACVAAVHRVGTLEVGDLAVVVAASAGHRAEAFAACREVIERLKASVPIWKHEHYVDGEATWLRLEQD